MTPQTVGLCYVWLPYGALVVSADIYPVHGSEVLLPHGSSERLHHLLHGACGQRYMNTMYWLSASPLKTSYCINKCICVCLASVLPEEQKSRIEKNLIKVLMVCIEILFTGHYSWKMLISSFLCFSYLIFWKSHYR